MFISGSEAVISHGRSRVGVMPRAQVLRHGEKIEFSVFTANKSNTSYVFSTENISATFNGNPLKVYSYEELKEEVRREAARKRIGAMMAGYGRAISSASTGSQYTYNQYTGPIYTYDYGAVNKASQENQAQTTADLNRIADDETRQANSITENILRKHTVAPGVTYGGGVTMERVRLRGVESGVLNVVVDIEGDRHSFEFVLSPVEK